MTTQTRTATRQSVDEARRAGIDLDAARDSVAEGTRLTSRGPVNIIGRSQVDPATQTDSPASQARPTIAAVAPAVPASAQQQQARPGHRLLTTTAMRMQAERGDSLRAAPPTVLALMEVDSSLPIYDPTGAVRDAMDRLDRPRPAQLTAPDTVQWMVDMNDRELILQAQQEARERMPDSFRRGPQVQNHRRLQIEAAARNDALMEQVIAQRRTQAPQADRPDSPRRRQAPTAPVDQPRSSRRRRNRTATRTNHPIAPPRRHAGRGQGAYEGMPHLESLDYD